MTRVAFVLRSSCFALLPDQILSGHGPEFYKHLYYIKIQTLNREVTGKGLYYPLLGDLRELLLLYCGDQDSGDFVFESENILCHTQWVWHATGVASTGIVFLRRNASCHKVELPFLNTRIPFLWRGRIMTLFPRSTRCYAQSMP